MLLIYAFLQVTTAHANFVSYVDDQGTKHFVQSEAEVPEKYRDKTQASRVGDPDNVRAAREFVPPLPTPTQNLSSGNGASNSGSSSDSANRAPSSSSSSSSSGSPSITTHTQPGAGGATTTIRGGGGAGVTRVRPNGKGGWETF